MEETVRRNPVGEKTCEKTVDTGFSQARDKTENREVCTEEDRWMDCPTETETWIEEDLICEKIGRGKQTKGRVIREDVYSILTEESDQDKFEVGLTDLNYTATRGIRNCMHVCDTNLGEQKVLVKMCTGKGEDQRLQMIVSYLGREDMLVAQF